jgi:hypothetical protein
MSPGAPDRFALFTTVYPSALRYLSAWWVSVGRQTDRDFETWIGLDGVSPEEVARTVGTEIPARWVHGLKGETPAALRNRAIAEMVGNCDAVIFVDSDDELLPTRVASARDSLRRHDLSGCALRLIDDEGRDLGLVFGADAGSDWQDFLPRYNVFGLSNTAYRSALLGRLGPVAPECVAMDWNLASRAWCAGASLDFDAIPRMAYRQHGSNVARVLPPFSAADVARAARFVRQHYRLLLEGEGLPESFRQRVHQEGQRVAQFEADVVNRPDTMERYLESLNRLEPRLVWWWTVAHPALESIWRS